MGAEDATNGARPSRATAAPDFAEVGIRARAIFTHLMTTIPAFVFAFMPPQRSRHHHRAGNYATARPATSPLAIFRHPMAPIPPFVFAFMPPQRSRHDAPLP